MAAASLVSEILDTNVLLRYIVGDVPEQKEQVEQWLREAQAKKRKLIITPIVVAEIAFVLESFYKQNHQKIAEALELLISQRWLRIESRRELLTLWPWYRAGMHFVDSFLLAWTHVHKGTLLTFDKQLMRKH